MKKTSLLLNIFLVLLISCSSVNKTRQPSSINEVQINSSYLLLTELGIEESEAFIVQNEREFLERVGFIDYSKLAENEFNLTEEKENIPAGARPLLEQNSSRFKMIGLSRELGVLTRLALHRAVHSNRLDETTKILIPLATYLASPFPLIGLDPLPTTVTKNSYGKKRFEIRKKYLKERANERFKIEKSLIIARLAELFLKDHSDDKKGLDILDEFASELIAYQYENSGLQQSRYMGRAMIASLVRFARLNHHQSIEDELKKSLSNEKLFLENFISSHLHFRNREQKEIAIKVYNGDFAGEYSTGAEAYHITFGVVPSVQVDKDLADDLKMTSSIIHLPAQVSDGAMVRAFKNRKAGYILSESDEKLISDAFNPQFVRGFSHVGLTEVRKDPESGIEMVWIWDVYPYKDLGGVRYQTPENFAYPERYNRIGFTHYDPKKVLIQFKKQYEKFGYREKVWESYGSVTDETGISIDKKRVVPRFTYIDSKTVERWSLLDESLAEKWYFEEFTPKAIETVSKFLTTKDAHGFAYGFTNIESTSYCSLLVVLSYLQGTNFDPQVTHDDWRGFVKFLKKLRLVKYNMKERIVSPNGFSWQKELVQSVKYVDIDRTQVFEQTDNPRYNYIDRHLEKGKTGIDPTYFKSIYQEVSPFKSLNNIDVDDDDL